MWIYDAINVWVLLAGALGIVYLYIRHQFSFWAKKGVPFIEPHVLGGNFGDAFMRKAPMTDVLVKLYNDLKGHRFGGVWQFFSPTVFIIDPDILRNIFVKDFNAWPDRGQSPSPDNDPLAGNLATFVGNKWKVVRAKLTPTFTSAKLKQMHYLLLECSKDLEKYLDVVANAGKPIEVKEMIAKFATDVIGSCAFGIQMNSLNDEDAIFRKMGKKLGETTMKERIAGLLQVGAPWLFQLLKLTLTPPEVTKFFINIMKDTFDHRDKNNIQRHDFVDLLRELRNTNEKLGEDDVVFDEKLLTAQAFVFFGAGFETSSITISYCLHELAVNQDIQDRLRKEVHDTKAANDGEITWEGLKTMKYLDMVLKETLRKYPIAPQTQRRSVQPYVIPGSNVELPAGTRCIIPIYPLHHDPQYYPEPEKFIPERFTEEAKSQRPAMTYIPFGAGPRNCIGLRFAEYQSKMAILKVVDKFKVSLSEKSQNPLQLKTPGPFILPEIGVWVNISRNQ